MHETIRVRRGHVCRWLFPALLSVSIVWAASCSRVDAVEDIPEGTEVIVTLEDGTLVQGRLMSVQPDTLLVQKPGSKRERTIARSAVAEVERADDKGLFVGRLFEREPAFDEFTVPAGTVTKIGAGAVAGTIIGVLAGGKKGAAVGAAVGGGAGTAVVLATAGDEVGVRVGRELRVELASAITVRVRHQRP